MIQFNSDKHEVRAYTTLKYCVFEILATEPFVFANVNNFINCGHSLFSFTCLCTCTYMYVLTAIHVKCLFSPVYSNIQDFLT